MSDTLQGPGVHPLRLGRYVDLELLGEGGMGAVYRGRDPSLDRVVAIKVVTNNRPEFVARFRREARAIAKLSHPHVVQVFDFGEDDAGHPWFVMELLPGRSLDKVLAARGPLPPAEVIDLLRQAAEGLEAAHAVDIVHRDIKPANLVVDDRGQLKLVDFGIAHLEEGGDALTRPQSLMGTPHYMAPEMLRGEKVDGRADLYALGLTAFHLLAGRPPYEAPSSIAITVKHLSEPLPDLSQLAPKTPPALVRLVEQLAAKSRDDRPASARAVVEALEAIEALGAPEAGMRGPERTSAPPPAPRSEAGSAGRKGLPPALLVGGALVVLVGVGAGMALRKQGPEGGGGTTGDTGTGRTPPTTVVTARPADLAAAPAVDEAAGPLRLSVLKFKNLGGDPAYDGLVEGTADAVIDALQSVPGLTLVERNQIDLAVSEIDFGQSRYVDKQTAAALGNIKGVQVVVQGGFQLWQEQLRINARLVRVATGEVLDSLTVTRPKKDAFALQDDVARQLSRRIGALAAATKR